MTKKDNLPFLQIGEHDGTPFLNGRKLKFVACHSRDIWGNKDYIVKTDDWKHLQNGKEWRRWKKIKKADRKYFVEPLFLEKIGKNTYLVTKRIYRAKRRITNKDREIIKRLREKYKLKDIFIKPDYNEFDINWFINRDTNLPIIYDYAL